MCSVDLTGCRRHIVVVALVIATRHGLTKLAPRCAHEGAQLLLFEETGRTHLGTGSRRIAVAYARRYRFGIIDDLAKKLLYFS